MRLASKGNIVWRLCEEQARCLPGSLGPRIITPACQVSVCLSGPAKRMPALIGVIANHARPVHPGLDGPPRLMCPQLLGRASVPCWFCKCPCILLDLHRLILYFCEGAPPLSWLLAPSLFSRQHILFFRYETGTFALSSLFWELTNTLKGCGTYH